MKNLESPQILSDLYRDLRDRQLLPLVVVLIVGMAVVPILLSKSPEAAPPPAIPTPVAAKSNAPTQQVVVSDPGVRNYKKRLAGDAPKDPFVQQFLPVASANSGTPSSGQAGSGTTVSGTGTSVGSDTSTGSTTLPSTGGGTTTAGGGTAQSKYYSYRVKVRTGKLDGKPLDVRDSVDSLSPLPSAKVPAVQFLGVQADSGFNAKTAVFLVSPAVSSVDGEGKCTLAGTACQLLYLKPGEHEDLVWSDGLTYRIDLVKFNLIARNSLPAVENKKSGKGGKSGRKSSPKRYAGSYFSF
jgi:hypothetical protein